MRFRSSCLLMLAVLTLCLCVAPGSLPAEETCRVRVETILAGRNDAVVDPQLKRHIGELQSMFNYTSYRLIGSESLTLSVGRSGTVSLPGNRLMKITPNKISGSRADIALRMMKRKQTVFQTQIQILNRGSLFVGGPKYQDGDLIFKISSSF